MDGLVVDPRHFVRRSEKEHPMRKLILRMELTLDGVAAGENGPIDMVDYGDEGSWSDIFATLETVDAMLIGAGTHREYLSYWQSALTSSTATANERKFAAIAARTPHFVLSRTLRTVEWPNASVLAGGVEAIASLKRQGGRDIIMWGGPTVAAAAIEAELIDEYHLVTHPVIAGRGKRLFANVAATHRVRHLSTKSFPSGVVLVKHARA
jgi:dihydrofolate reductase